MFYFSAYPTPKRMKHNQLNIPVSPLKEIGRALRTSYFLLLIFNNLHIKLLGNLKVEGI